MARPRTVSDAAILAAARAVFLEHGPSAPTADVAERCGLSQAALFKRFGTKADLLVAALVPPAVPPFAAALGGGPDPGTPLRDQLVVIAMTAGAFFAEIVPCLTVLSAAGIPPTQMLERFEVPPPITAQRAVAGWFGAAMDAGLVRRADPFAVAFALLGALHMRAFTAHITNAPLDAAAAAAWAESIVDTLWRGLAPIREDSP